MNKNHLRILLLTDAVVVAIAFLSYITFFRDQQQEVQADIIALVPPTDISGFARADSPRTFVFPDDHAAHPEYQTEWWYYTGNLQSEDGQRFGYQLTFFRRALIPPGETPERLSGWASDQAYMAHFALTAPDLDPGSGKHYQAFQRFSRGAAGLAGAQARPFQVWLEDWRVEEKPADRAECQAPAETAQPCAYFLRAADGEILIELTLQDAKGAILQGDQGYSQKGPDPGNASYYYSLTRLQSGGRIVIQGRQFQVSGLSWMDHEFSTSALSTDQVGWDWFSMQFDDGSELMVFQIRKADGSIDPYSSGAWIAPDGTTTALLQTDFSIEVLDSWNSPHSGASYPSRWKISIPKIGATLDLAPIYPDQELNLAYSYWEGAVQIDGTLQGNPIAGRGYVELTGYSGSMGGEF